MSKSKNFISLAEHNPELIVEWHPTRNGDLTPNDISYGSAKKVWWLGKCGHEWEQNLNHRSRGRGCPICAQNIRGISHSKNWIAKHGSLADRNPELAKQWHPTKNEPLTAKDVSAGSGNKAWWICPEGHEWEAVIASRNKGVGCPICSGHKVLVGYNDLRTIKPDIANQWHPYKNGNLLPTDVTVNSGIYAWWVCSLGHEWKAVIGSRTSGTGCPICANKNIVAGFNDFESSYPELMKEWHPTLNEKVKPYEVSPHSSKKVWWKCYKGHEWEAMISNRVKGTGCPICSSEIKTSFPEQAIFYYFKQVTTAYNRYLFDRRTEADIYLPEYKIAIEYDGQYYHQGEDSSRREKSKEENLQRRGITLIRVKEVETNHKKIESYNIVYSNPHISDHELNGVIMELIARIEGLVGGSLDVDVDISRDRGKIYEQYILGEKERSLLELQPELATQWHPLKNGKLLPENVTISANKKVWWICDKGHEWQAMINSRAQGVGCPYCSSQKVYTGFNDLATKNPDVAKQWHPSKNGDITPQTVLPHSNKSYWWICEKGHEWKDNVSHRSRGRNCPICSGRRVLQGYNDLATVNPFLASQWHPSKNGNFKPIEVTSGSDKKVWWLCDKGHEWDAAISSRNSGVGCPFCAGQRLIEGQNDLLTANPSLANEWHPTKNGEILPNNVMVNSNKKVWWLGKCGHEWEAIIASRNVGRGCPYCASQKLLVGFNDLATKNPELAKEWHPTKNGDKTPQDFMPGSNKKVWWICEKGHEWENSINTRNSGHKCPYCANQMLLVGFNDLATLNPTLALQWHPTKNGDSKPSDFIAGANKKAWWICEKGHEWEALICSRNKGAGCQECYNLRRGKKNTN